MKFKAAHMAGVCGAGLFVKNELYREGAPEISGGISISHWQSNKMYRHRVIFHKPDKKLCPEAMTVSEPLAVMRH